MQAFSCSLCGSQRPRSAYIPPTFSPQKAYTFLLAFSGSRAQSLRTQGAQMGNTRDTGALVATIKARIPKRQKAMIVKLARARQLDEADILREAIRFYLARARASLASEAAIVPS